MPVSYTVTISALYLGCGILIFLLGLTILRIGRSSAPTRAAALMLFFAGIGPLLSATGIIIESTLRQGSVVYQSMLESFEYLWEFYFPSLMLFALTFPKENRVLRRYPVLGFVLFFPYISHLAIIMFGDRMLDFVEGLYKVFPTDRSLSLGSREVAVGGFDNVINVVVRILERAHRHFFAIVNIVYSVVALLFLWRNRVRLMNPRLIRQVRTVGVGLTVSVVCYTFVKVASFSSATRLSQDVNLALINFSLVAAGGTVAYAVVRQQFLGIRYVFRRALLYSAVAVLFALLYLVVVRPVSDFLVQYSSVSREVFETGFIVIAIIAFQPALIRAEEILERLLLKGKVDAAGHFKHLGDAVAASTTVEELEETLRDGLRDAVDASAAKLHALDEDARRSPFVALLAEIGEPVRREDLQRLREEETERRRGGFLRRLTSGHRDGASVPSPGAAALEDAGPYEAYVPILRDGRCVGYIGLGEKIFGVPYENDEIALLSVLSTQVGAALQNIYLLKRNVERQLFEEELKIARKIQTQLLPGDPPPLPGFQLCAQTVPSRYVGGDYYDFVVVEDRWLVLVVADVSGKGIPASILTATLQAAVRSNVDAQVDPGVMMARLNELMFRNTSAEEFATLFYGVLDLQDGRLRYANAGHEFPYMVNGGGAEPLGQSGIVLGCLEDFAYSVEECELPGDAVLAIYTDGITECESSGGDFYGTGRLQAVLERHADGSASHICHSVVDDVRRFGGSDSQDDLTLVVLRRGG